MRWKLVVEGDSGRDEARASASVFVDMLRAQGHTIRQVTFYGDTEKPGEDLVTSPVAIPVAVAIATPEPAPEALPEEPAAEEPAP